MANIDLRRYTRSRLGMVSPRLDVFQWMKAIQWRREAGTSDSVRLLEQARRYWDSLDNFRERAIRAFKYYSGDQWSDVIDDPDSLGQTIIEEDYISGQGKIPLKQNIMRQIGKNLLGQYRTNPTQSIVNARAREEQGTSEMLSNALQCAQETNMTTELDARMFEQFFLCGLAMQKIRYRLWPERELEDVWLENINQHRVFFNTNVQDPRLPEINMIGEIIDTTIDNIIASFAKSKKDEQRLRDLYQIRDKEKWATTVGLSDVNIKDISFYLPADPDTARLFEIWHMVGEWRYRAHDPIDGSVKIYTDRKEADEINEERKQMAREQGIPAEEVPLVLIEDYYDQPWKVKYLTPYGDVLYEAYAEDIYKHREHPYIMALYPLINGRVWGMMEDIIDQQRYINRLIILLDFIISASAKGVLLVYEDQIPDGDREKFLKDWRSFNGVIILNRNNLPGDLPKQISANSTNVGIVEMLTIQMRLVQEISGVNTAIQGIQPQSGTPASRYAMESQHSSLNNLDLMSTYSMFKQKRDMKMLKVITQFYQEPRYLAIAGTTFSEEAKLYNPEKVKDMEFDVVVSRSNDTPIDRMRMDEMLLELLKGQFINIEQYLEHCSMPYADKMLDTVKKQKEMLQQGQVPEGLPPEQMQQLQAQGNPQAMAMLNQMLQK
jgi:hypothetical protein